MLIFEILIDFHFIRLKQLIPLIFFFTSFVANAQSNYCNLGQKILKTAKVYHYSPPNYDHNFDKLVEAYFLESVDPYKLFFTSTDESAIADLFHGSTSALIDGKCQHLVNTASLFEVRINEVKKYINSLSPQLSKFQKEDSLKFSIKKACSSQKEIFKRWDAFLHLSYVQSYISSDSLLQVNDSDFKLHIEQNFNREIERINCLLNSYTDSIGNSMPFLSDIYLTALSKALDPHSEYFKPEAEAAFNNSLSKTSYSFGLQFEQNQFGEAEITYLSPGSAAANSKQLEIGDILYSIKSSDIIINGNCIEDDAMVQILFSDDIKEATFEIRKKNGKVIELNLTKSEVNVDENIIQSYLLEGDEKIGYIYLPSFYTNFDETNYQSKGAARDIAKKLIKMEMKGAKALILDLRGNGGGSMEEARRLTSMFIDYGVVSATQTNDEEEEIMQDLDRGKIFNKPLIILVNSRSASASELFAGAMQNYNRAIIVGDTTLGKGSMQIVLPVEAYAYEKYAPDLFELDAEAFLKITIGMFYLPNSESHQQKGIIPDILLPQLYKSNNEKSLKNSLEAKNLNQKITPRADDPINLEKVKKGANLRLDTSSYWANLDTFSKFLSRTHYKGNYPLNISSFQHFYNYTDSLNLQLEDIKNHTIFKVSPLLNGGGIEFSEKRKKELINNIYSDQYILEAFHIGLSLIHSK